MEGEILNRSRPVLIHFLLEYLKPSFTPSAACNWVLRGLVVWARHTGRSPSSRMDAGGYNSIFFHVF
jgi:hypothetical protein